MRNLLVLLIYLYIEREIEREMGVGQEPAVIVGSPNLPRVPSISRDPVMS
jgi:hypothetical protein